MESSVTQLSERLSKIELEYNLAVRKREDGVKKAIRALSEITPEDVELLQGVVPGLAVVTQYTEKDLMENLQGEVAMVQQVVHELTDYLEHRLRFYEEQL